MVILGIDPSFTGMGISIIDAENKQITLAEIKGTMGRSFQETFNNSINVVSRVIKLVSPFKVSHILSEEPFNGAMASSGLYQLDSLLFFNLITLKSFQSIHTIHPSYLKTIHGHSKYKKSESTELAKEFLNIFLNNDYECNKTKFSHNVSESFIYACKLYYKMSDTNEISKELYRIKPCLKDNKEKLLYKK